MEENSKSLNLAALSVLLFACCLLLGHGPAYGMVSETEFSTSLSEATGVVRVFVALFGGIIGVLGIVVAFRGVSGTADVEVSVSDHGKLSMKQVSQGVVITLIGTLYLLPEKKSERQIKGNQITIERNADGETINLEQRTM